MVLGDSHRSCFVDRCANGELFLGRPIFAGPDWTREGCRPLVAVVVEPALSELATIDESDDNRRRGMYACVAELLWRRKRTMPSSSLNIGF